MAKESERDSVCVGERQNSVVRAVRRSYIGCGEVYMAEAQKEIYGKPKISKDAWGIPVAEEKTRIVKPEVPEPVMQSCIRNVDGCPMLSVAGGLVQAMPETYTRTAWDFYVDVRWGKIFPAIQLEFGADGKPIVRTRIYTRCKLFCREIWTHKWSKSCEAFPTDTLRLEPRQTRNALLRLTLPKEQMQFVRIEAGIHGINPSAEVAVMVLRAVSGS